MEKFNLTDLLNSRSKEIEEAAGPKENPGEQQAKENEIIRVDVYDLIPSQDNFYHVDDDLKQSIELMGILQPLLVNRPQNGKYKIIAGHRRRLAVLSLLEEGKEELRYVPCVYKKEDMLDQLALIMANRFRDKTDWEKMMEAIQAEDLAKELKKEYEIRGRTREILTEITGVKEAQLGRYKAIYNNLSPRLMEKFKEGVINLSVAVELCGISKEGQEKAADKAEDGPISLQEAREMKQQEEDNKEKSVPMPDGTATNSLISNGQINMQKEYNGVKVMYFMEAVIESNLFQEEFWEGWKGSTGTKEEYIAGHAGLSATFTFKGLEIEQCTATLTNEGLEITKSGTGERGTIAYNELTKLIDLMNQTGIIEIETDENNTGNEESQKDEYKDPQPENIISICYSCENYETCQEKKSTVTSCNAYIDRKEARKTNEQRYEEEQAALDRETARKLKEQQQEEKMERLPSGSKKKAHEIEIAPSKYTEITERRLAFYLLKNEGYKAGETAIMLEYAEGRETGREIGVEITYVWEDWTGLEDGYCIIGLDVISFDI